MTALIVAIIAGVFAVVSAFFAARSQWMVAAAQRAHDRQRPFVEVQLKYYVEITEIVAQIPRTNDRAREELVIRFWHLYWGPLALVEDNEVAAAMIAYGELLTNNPVDANGLERKSLVIAHACRNSLKRLWVPTLGDIEPKNARPLTKLAPQRAAQQIGYESRSQA